MYYIGHNFRINTTSQWDTYLRLITITMASKHFGVSLKQLRELMEFRKSEGIHKLNEIGGLQGLLDALNTSEELGIHRDINFRKKCAILLKPTMEINITYYFLHRYLWRQIWPPNQKRRVRIQHNSSKAIQDIPSIGLGGLARNYTYYFGDSCCCLFRYVFIILVTQIKHLIWCKKLRIILKFTIN